MADGIYVGMSGAISRAAQLDAVSDNLANAETPGFKAARPAFQSFLPRAAVTDKVQSAAVAGGLDLRPGATITTDQPLDVVPNDASFLAIQTPAGARAFTRNGHIEVTGAGALTIDGNPLLGADGAPLTVPVGAAPEIRPNGDLVVDRSVVGRVGLFDLSGPLGRSGPTLIVPAAGATVTPVDGTLRTGALEGGNATALESTVAMIGAQRSFESAMQAIQTYRSLDQKAVEVGHVR
ncbi:MAG: flagellar hook basal-body protein [Pseudomonadota bacterium]